MSGITPLIDTLLHQVLGRQGEVSLQRALSEPVKPVSSGEGPRPIQGDSDLDGRPPAALNDLRRMPGSLGGERQFTPANRKELRQGQPKHILARLPAASRMFCCAFQLPPLLYGRRRL